MIKKDIVIGLGEIGFPILKLLSKKIKVDGFDKIEKLNTNNFSNIKNIELVINLRKKKQQLHLMYIHQSNSCNNTS